MRVLIAEDEPLLAEALAVGLRREAMAVDVVEDGAAALERLSVNDYDVLLLDRDLPEVHGDVVCRTTVQCHPSVAILMLTAAGEIAHRVDGLGMGADDYLVKPFALQELIARVRALARRTRVTATPLVDRHDVSLDPARLGVTRAGTPVPLSRKEFGVLEELLRADGAVLSAEVLLEKVWDENTDPFTNVVRVTIQTLRRKLGEPPLIETIRGAGYRIP